MPTSNQTTPKQTTLKKSASLTGISLHTGKNVTLTIKPAPANHGYKFVRIDLPDHPVIDAHVSKVQKVERATTLADGNVSVHTVEHVISALSGLGVDNAIIEMDANEPPIGDGSAQPYIDLIEQTGIETLETNRPIFTIRETLHLETKNGSLLTIVPDKEFRITCTSFGPNGAMTQFFTTKVTPDIYAKEIGPARTFTFYEDVEPLLEKGLIKGGSLENAVVIRDNNVLSKEPMRYDNEFARHKALDIIGDFALSGHRIAGHVIAVLPGHNANTQMARIIDEQFQSKIAKIPKQIKIPSDKDALDINEIMTILPHRYPFLLVDRIIGFEGDTKISGVKNVTINEPFFQGHFPRHPVMPGVLQLEAMAQVASILILRKSENQGKIGYFMSADKIKFRKPVMPGDTLLIEAELTRARGSIGSANTRCSVNGDTTSEGVLKFAIIEK